MTDPLDQLSDRALAEIVAVECAGIIKCDKWGPSFHPLAGVAKTDCGHENCHPACYWPPKFSTSADAVLPLLDAFHWWSCDRTEKECRVDVTLSDYTSYTGYAPTFARAACLALVRAKRASVT